MEASVRLGRIAGIEVGLNWSLAIVFVLIVWTLASQVLPSVVPDQPQSGYWIAAIGAALLFYTSLLAHELGHALVARRLGVEVEGITLWLFGGVATLRGESATAGIEARIAIAGPIVSAVLALAFGGVTFALDTLNGPPLVEGGAVWLAFSNLMLTLFNLVPAFPLDGGRILRAWLWSRAGDRYRATSTAAWWGRAIAVLMVALGLLALFLQGAISGLWLIFLGWFLLSAARSEESKVLLLGALAGLRVADVMSPDPTIAPGWITVEEFLRSYVPAQHSIAYPLKTFEGVLDGLVTLSRLAQVPDELRRATRVRDIGCGLDEVAQAEPWEPVSALLDRFAGCGEGQVLVLDGGKLVGIVSPTDITRLLGAAAAGRRSA